MKTLLFILVATAIAATSAAVAADTAPREAAVRDLRGELGSPQQEVRDKAAAELRATYREIPKSRWIPVVETLKKGLTRTQVLELLKPYNIHMMGMNASGSTYTEQYQLDDGWNMVCGYEDRGDVLIYAELAAEITPIYVKAPANFTGIWTIYYINGQKYQAVEVQSGQYVGAFTMYSSDGAVAEESHYNKKGSNGPYLGYYPSGKQRFQGEYKDGKRVGIWTYYDEAGNVTSTQNQDKP